MRECNRSNSFLMPSKASNKCWIMSSSYSSNISFSLFHNLNLIVIFFSLKYLIFYVKDNRVKKSLSNQINNKIYHYLITMILINYFNESKV